MKKIKYILVELIKKVENLSRIWVIFKKMINERFFMNTV